MAWLLRPPDGGCLLRDSAHLHDMEEHMDRLRILLAALLTAVALHLFAPSLTV